MSRRALVTGATGFVGQWLCRQLLQDGWTVFGTRQEATPPSLLDGREQSAITWIDGDLRDPDIVRAAVEASRPHAVIHLAGVSFVPTAQADPASAWEINTLVAVRLLALLSQLRASGEADPRVLLIGSGEQYGRQPAHVMPLPETQPLLAATVYAATKSAQEIAGLQACRSTGLQVVCTRSFNHSGAGQSGDFVFPATVRRVLQLRAAGTRELKVGNLDAVRDFLHVRDVVSAYLALVEHGTPGQVYNVASGEGTSVLDITRLTLERAGVDAELVRDPDLLRPIDVPVLVGNPARLRAATGWQPRYTVTDIIDELIHATPN